MTGWVKIHQVPHVIFEIKSYFFCKLFITLQSHERWLFCTFLAETLYHSSKEAHQSVKFETFDCSRENSPNLYFDSLLLKVYQIWAKEGQRNYVSRHLWVMQNLKKNWFLVSKMARFLWILTRALKSLKNLTLIAYFGAKYITFDLKKCRGVISHDSEEWCKIWNKNWLGFWKTTWEIWQIFTRALEKVKIGALVESFYPKYKMHELKFTEASCVMTLKNDEKFEKELTCCFKIDMRNLLNFEPGTQDPQKFAL